MKMTKTITSFAFLTLAAMMLTAPTAQAESVQAKVIGLKGEATVNVPGEGSKKLSNGDLIPEGSTIETSEDGNVVLGLMPGAATVVQTSTTVTLTDLKVEKKDEKIAKRVVKLDMPSDDGGVLNFLNEMDGVSDYRVQTPTGVAAARGTAFLVSGGTISVANGTVTFTSSSGATFSIPQGSLFNGQSGTVTQMSAADVAALTAAVGAAIASGEASGNIQAALDIASASSDNPANTSETIISPEQ